MWEAAKLIVGLAIGVTITGAALVMIATFLANTFGSPSGGEPRECYTDWDGRSNPTVCD